MAIGHGIESPEEFVRDIEQYARDLEDSGAVEYLHLKSGRTLAVLDAGRLEAWVAAFRALDDAELRRGLREAYADVAEDRVRPALESLDALAAELGVLEA